MQERHRFILISAAVAVLVGAVAWVLFRPDSPGTERPLTASMTGQPAESDSTENVPTSSMGPEGGRIRATTATTRPVTMRGGSGLIWGWVEHGDGRPGGRLTVEMVHDTYSLRNVMATSRPKISVRSDDNGYFVRVGLADGAYALLVRDGDLVGTSDVWVQDGAMMGTTLVLRESGEIAGRVVDGRGTPVAGARVAPAPVGDPEAGWRRILDVLAVSTDEDGRFAMAGAPLEPVFVVAYGPDGRSVVSDAITPDASGLELVLSDGTRLAGTTVDDTTGEAVGGVSLLALPRDVLGPPASVTSGDDGRFAVENLRPGFYSIMADDDAYVLAEALENFPLEPGGKDDTTVRVSAGGMIAGRVVVASTEEPVSGVMVRAQRYRGPPSDERFYSAIAPSRADGAFFIQALPPGHYGLKTDGDGGHFPARDIEVQLRAGQTLDGIDLSLMEGTAIQGRVVDDAGEPVADATVILQNERNGYIRRQSGEGGRFAFTAVSPFDRTAIRAEYAGRQSPNMVLETAASAGSGEVLLRLDPAGTAVLEGDVVDLDNLPVKGHVDFEMRSESGRRGLRAEPDEQGHFVLRRVPPGTYTATASAWYGPGRARLDEPLEVADNQHVEGLRFVLDARTTGDLDVTGIVVDEAGEPVENALIHVSPPGDEVRTDGGGRFAFSDLAADSVRIWVTHRELGTGEGTADGANPDVRIVLKKGENSAGPIHGRVIDAATGAPIPRFRVDTSDNTERWKNTDWFRHYLIDFTDPEGRFELSENGQAGRSYTLYAWAEGYAVTGVSGGFDLEAGYTIALNRGRRISGRVVDQNYGPVAGAYVYAGPVPESYYRSMGFLAISDSEGLFTLFDVGPNVSVVSAARPGFSDAEVEISADGDVNDVVLQLFAGTVVEINVTLNGWDPYTLSATATPTDVNQRSMRNIAAPSGTIRLEDVAPGPTRISLGADPKPPLRGTWSIDSVIDLPAGRTTTFDFVLPPCTAAFEGTVRQLGEPVTNGEVHVSYYDNEYGAGAIVAKCDATGAFRFPAIPEGRARVSVPLHFATMEEARDFRAMEPVDIHLVRGQTTRVDFELPSRTEP